MKWGALGSITTIVILMTLFEWPRIRQNRKKDKAAFIVVLSLVCMLAVLLTYFPGLPGPDDWVEAIYKPLGKLLEK